jgi:hypothetical protein
MARFFNYIDSSDDYLPGDIAQAQVSRFKTAMDRADALSLLRMSQMDFKPDNMGSTTMGGEAFAAFANLQKPTTFFNSGSSRLIPAGLQNLGIPGISFGNFIGV